MALNPKTLAENIEDSEQLRDTRLAHMADFVRRYLGPTGSAQDTDVFPENHYFDWVSLVLPQIVFHNPTVKITTTKSAEYADDATALELGTNRLIRDIDLRTDLWLLGLDYGFSWAVALISPEKVPGSDEEDPAHKPSVQRLSQHRFGMDSAASAPSKARFTFHVLVEDKEDLEEKAKGDDTWIPDAIDRMTTGVGLDEINRDSAANVPDRGEVTYYEVWVPEDNEYLEDGDDPDDYHGTIFTLAKTKVGNFPHDDIRGEWIRKPRAFYGPRWGPYVLFGAYSVPDQLWPLSPLAATTAQVEELNRHAQALSVAGARRKRFMAYDEQDTADAKKLLNVRDGGGLGIRGFDKSRFAEIELGGITEVGLAYYNLALDRVQKSTGINDAQRGEVAGKGTATEVSAAMMGGNVRLSFLQEKFTWGVRRMAQTLTWYLRKDDRVRYALGDEAKERYAQDPSVAGPLAEMGVPIEDVDFYFEGGDFDLPYEDMELQIEPYSLQRSTDSLEQARAMQMFAALSSAAPLMPQTPWLDWPGLVSDVGNVMRWPDAHRRIDKRMLAEVGGQFLQAGGPLMASGGNPEPEPRLGRDVGIRMGDKTEAPEGRKSGARIGNQMKQAVHSGA